MRSVVRVCVAVMTLLMGSFASPAADYPTKPISLIVNFAAGSTTDIAARMLAEQASKVLGGTIVVINRAGASGTLGIAEVARAAPDGYTIGTANMPALSIIPQTRSVPYDPEKDVVQIAAVVSYEYLTIANAKSSYKTWDEFVRYARDNPGKATYAGLGAGTTDHITMERMTRDLGITLRYVPFKDSDQLAAAALGGHVDVINSTVGPVAPSIRSGDLRVLLITSDDPLPDLAPAAPTMKQAGFKHSQVSYMSIVAPSGLSSDMRAKLEAAFKVATESPKILEDAPKMSLKVKFVPGASYQEQLRALTKDYAPIIAELGLREKQ
jgi:tripartite-type tricarboxylate transporter receptor subunit TctC